MADLHLKRKINIRIIVIYMPADDSDKLERKAINSKFESWIKQSIDRTPPTTKIGHRWKFSLSYETLPYDLLKFYWLID